MPTVKDSHARRIAVVALVAAAGAFMLGSAQADIVSEPDAAALQVQVNQFQAQLDEQAEQIEELQGDISTLHSTLGETINAVNDVSESAGVIDCLAYSDYHYYRERVGTKGPRYRLPVMVWNTSLRQCRPSAKPWRPHGRVLTPVVASR